MYELWLTSVIRADQLEQACAVFQGYCAMSPRHSFSRLLFFEGPDEPKALSRLPNRSLQWNELSQQLSRQSYVLKARYDVSEAKDFGTGQ